MNIYSYNQELQLASCCIVGIISSQARKKAWKKYWTSTGKEIMLPLVHRVTIGIKSRPVKLEQAVSESLTRAQESSLDPVPSSIRARNAQEKKHYKLWSHHMELGELSEPLHGESTDSLIRKQLAFLDLKSGFYIYTQKPLTINCHYRTKQH